MNIKSAGSHLVTVSSNDLLSPGVYIYRLEVKGETNNYSSTDRLIPGQINQIIKVSRKYFRDTFF